MNIKVKQIKIGLNFLTLITKISIVISFSCVTFYFFGIGYFPLESNYSIIFQLILIGTFFSIFLLSIIFGCFVYAPLTWIKLLSMPEVFFWWSYPLFIALMIVFSSGMRLFAPKDKSISEKALISSVCILSIIICFVCNLNFISSILMSKLKLANPNATLQIDNVACRALQEAYYPIKCNPKKPRYFLHNINVKWRSGEYYIVFRAGNETHGVTIPSAHILTADSIIKDNKE